MALELRPNCECCNRDLPPAATVARICSYECTFCADCVDNVLFNVCSNCGGGFAPPPDPARQRVAAWTFARPAAAVEQTRFSDLQS